MICQNKHPGQEAGPALIVVCYQVAESPGQWLLPCRASQYSRGGIKDYTLPPHLPYILVRVRMTVEWKSGRWWSDVLHTKKQIQQIFNCKLMRSRVRSERPFTISFSPFTQVHITIILKHFHSIPIHCGVKYCTFTPLNEFNNFICCADAMLHSDNQEDVEYCIWQWPV